MQDKRRKIILIAACALIVLVMLAVCWFAAIPLVRLADDPEAFKLWIDGFGSWGRLVFVGLLALQVIVAFIPGGPFELVAGYAYGIWEGTLLCMVAFLIGSWIVFTLVRKFGMKLVEFFVSKKEIKELSFLKNPKKTRTLAFILMVIPGSPKDALNYVAGLTNLKLGDWLLIVMIGRIPALVSTVVSGAAAGEQNYLLSALVMAGTAIVSGFGILYYRHLCKKENEINPTA